MTEDQSHDRHGERESTQALAKIQHSQAHHPKREPKPKRAALVADPENRLVDGKVDPATKELKPDRS